MARRVNQVQDVLLPVVSRVVQADRVGLDRDAALALEVHGVQDGSISRAWSAPVYSRKRSASVDLPWSMCAMIEKFRMFCWFKDLARVGGGRPALHYARDGLPSESVSVATSFRVQRVS